VRTAEYRERTRPGPQLNHRQIAELVNCELDLLRMR
jgi:hypothetical protein